MEKNKDIGKAIKEKLDALDRSPRDQVWAGIEAELDRKKKRRIPPFWFMIFGLLAGVIILFTIVRSDDAPVSIDIPTEFGPGGDSVSGNPEENLEDDRIYRERKTKGKTSVSAAAGTTPENASDDNRSDENDRHGLQKMSRSSQNDINEGTEVSARQPSRNRPHKKTKISHPSAKMISGNQINESGSRKETESKNRQNPQQSEPLTGNRKERSANAEISDVNSVITQTSKDSIASDTATLDSIGKLPIDVPKKNDEKKKKENQQDSTKTELEEKAFQTFSVFGFFAPTTFKLMGGNSPIDTRLDANKVQAELIYNYGGYLSFKYDERWSFRFGMAKTDYQLTTKDVPTNSAEGGPINTTLYSNIDYNPGINAEFIESQLADSDSMDIKQKFSHYEFPIELRYRITGDKLTVNALAGVSTYFLKGSTVTAFGENGGSVVMGSTKNLNKAHFSGNIGVGLRYLFSKNFSVNLEPMFKYHFLIGQNHQEAYSLSVQAGIEYNFNWKIKAPKKPQ